MFVESFLEAVELDAPTKPTKTGGFLPPTPQLRHINAGFALKGRIWPRSSAARLLGLLEHP